MGKNERANDEDDKNDDYCVALSVPSFIEGGGRFDLSRSIIYQISYFLLK